MTEQAVAPEQTAQRLKSIRSMLHTIHAEISDVMGLPELMGEPEVGPAGPVYPHLTPAWSDLRNAMTTVGVASHLIETARARVEGKL